MDALNTAPLADGPAVRNALKDFFAANPAAVDYLIRPEGIEFLMQRVLGKRPISEYLAETRNVIAEDVAEKIEDYIAMAMEEDQEDQECADQDARTKTAQVAAGIPVVQVAAAAPVVQVAAAAPAARDVKPAARADCRNGKDCSNPTCTYLHPPDFKGALSRRLCPFSKDCTGRGCANLHMARSEVPKSKTPCTLFATKGTCKWGDGCRFSHEV